MVFNTLLWVLILFELTKIIGIQINFIKREKLYDICKKQSS